MRRAEMKSTEWMFPVVLLALAVVATIGMSGCTPELHVHVWGKYYDGQQVEEVRDGETDLENQDVLRWLGGDR